jgi:hypothetical protein
MKIKYDPPMIAWLACGTFTLSYVVFGACWFAVDLHTAFGESEKAIFDSRGLNVKHTSPMDYCELPYEECFCSTLPKEFHISIKCISKFQLTISRIIPLISFVLEIVLIRQFFSFSGNYRPVIISLLWIAFILVFVGMTILIYWNSCYHVTITQIIAVISMIICLLSTIQLLYFHDSKYVASDYSRVIIRQREEATHNQNQNWLDLL